jgi:hypothetical protein
MTGLNQIIPKSQIHEKKWEYSGVVHQLFIDFEKAYDSVRREVLYNILTEFGVPTKLLRLIKICLNEAYSKVQTGKFWTHFLLRKVWNKEMLCHHHLSTFL